MKLTQVQIQGFRNFKNALINFEDKTLIIGANDVGKTNLIYAIRILLDKTLSDANIEPKDSDFYAYDNTNEIRIILKFTEVNEDCVLAKLKENVSDTSELYIAYEAYRVPATNSKSYRFLSGPSVELMKETEDRYYKRVLNIKCINSRRDFWSYINKEKNILLDIAKNNRTEEVKITDDNLYEEIIGDLKNIDKKLPQLSYIANATTNINSELGKLSIYNRNQNIVFNAASSNIENFIQNISIASRYNEKSLLIGGDGRLNQIYLSLWVARNNIEENSLQEVSLICIEEPEAHLHPHQQRKLAEYLNTHINGQVIITSHSPQITSEFSPNSIIRLFENGQGTKAASNGCSLIINEAVYDLGYRMSIIPAEAFFADCVLLVEGQSEVIFYRALAKQLQIDLDRLNVSILSVEGVSFTLFAKILDALEIKYCIRTDNDINKTPRREEYRYAGIERLIKCLEQCGKIKSQTKEILEQNQQHIKGFPEEVPPQSSSIAAQAIIQEIESYGLFIAEKDLEEDLINSPLSETICNHFSKPTTEKEYIVEKMKEKKATFMYNYIKDNKESLSALKHHSLCKPLLFCQQAIEAMHYEA